MHGATTLYSGRYNGRPSFGLGSRENTLAERTYNRSSRNGLNGYNGKSMIERQPTFNSSSYVPTKYSGNHYMSSYDRDYGSTRTSRTTNNSDLVRPAMRPSRNRSTTRDLSNRRDSAREKSIPRARDKSLPREKTEYPALSSMRSGISKEPVRSSYAYKTPVFREIPSPSYKKTARTEKSTSSVSSNGTALTNGYTSPHRAIEVNRTIYQSESTTPPRKTYSTTSYSRSKTTNNNNNNTADESGSSSRSSANSRRSSDAIQNGEIGSSSALQRNYSIHAGLVGLKNIGNTCFMNSILQCLVNTKPLRDYCLDEKYCRDINRTSSPMKGKLVEAFSNIVSELWRPSSSAGTAVSTSSFKSQIQKFSSRFSGYEQHDSQEFLRFLIEGLHEDVNRVPKKHKEAIPNFDSLCDESKASKTWDFYLSKDNSYIVELFMGQLKSSLTCAECHHVSTTFDPFWDLSLPIPKDSYSSRLDLAECLENFTKEEILEGDERPTCDRCKARRRMTKKFTIYKFPKILVIHLKRFSEGSRFRHKLSADVRFRHDLEMRSPISTSPANFSLYAVSNHSGSCYGGHYTAFCKNPQTREWHSFNDSLVHPMSSSSVQTKEAYVLFYEMTSSRSRSHL